MTDGPATQSINANKEGVLAAVALRFAAWSERWFPDAFVFASIAVVVVALAAVMNGASFPAVARAFGDGFWSLIPFTLQQVMVVISGYIIASSPPAARLIDWLAGVFGRVVVRFWNALLL